VTVTVTTTKKKGLLKAAGSVVAAGLLSATLFAQTTAQTADAQPMAAQTAPAARYDNQIQTAVAKKLAAKSQFRDVKSSVEDGIVTLTGTVDLYQRKLDAAKLARKTASVQGVRDLVTVAGPNVPDEQLDKKLSEKMRYVRSGYDSTFDYFALNVKDGVVTIEGQDRTGVGRDEALADAANMPGVKDVVANISVEPVSMFDDGLRIRAERTLYRDPALSKYAMDPARPIRIIIDNGHVTLYGSVETKMDKEIAGIRANQLPGAFSVENKLMVDGKS
jgi:hyperosmotically inducible periplasmic protein